MALARTSSDSLGSNKNPNGCHPKTQSRVQFKILDLANLVLLKEFLRERARNAESSLVTKDAKIACQPHVLQLRKTSKRPLGSYLFACASRVKSDPA